MITGKSVKGHIFFIMLAVLINGFILAAIPQTSGYKTEQRWGESFNPIFLTKYEPPPPPPRPRPKEKPEIREIKLKKIPQVSFKEKQIKSWKPPQMQLNIPPTQFEINPVLKTGIAITPPPPDPAPVTRGYATIAPISAPVAASAPVNSQPVAESVPAEFESGEADNDPQILRKIEPSYPYSARRRNIQGNVIVRFLVTPDGNVRKPSIVESKPGGIFEKSVLEAVTQWRFRPGYYKGKAVAVWVVLPIQFNLSG